MTRAISTAIFPRTPVKPRPLYVRAGDARIDEIPLTAADGTRLALTRIRADERPRPAVLLLHGHTTSSDMFVLPETRNLVDVLLDHGYEAWMLDWRGSCRLPYNESAARYTFDDVALYDIPAAVTHIKDRIGQQPLLVVAHCMGALTLSMSLTAGLVPGLAGVVAQGVFLTPKLIGRARLRMTLGGELLRRRIDHLPVDFRKVGLRSRYALLFALAAKGAECPDPTCQILHNNAWGVGASLYVHANLHSRTCVAWNSPAAWSAGTTTTIATGHYPTTLSTTPTASTAPCCSSQAATTNCGATPTSSATRYSPHANLN